MNSINLLMIDDEDQFRQAIVRRLTRRGMNVAEAASGESGLKIIKNRPVDVIILDVRMPGMNGLEVLDVIKREYHRIEVILLTGQATLQDGVAGIKAGAFDYLSKPVELEQLEHKIIQAYQKIQYAVEMEKAEQVKKQMEKQMMTCERLASIGTLAAGIAHEINNPLAIINESSGYLSSLLNRSEIADKELKEHLVFGLQTITKSVVRASRITHQLLGFVRENNLVVENVDISEIINELIVFFKTDLQDKNTELSIQIEPSAKKFETDAVRFRQIILNLFTNAVHSIEQSGKITITVDRSADGIDLVVQDTGCGIPPENIDKIFDPFFTTKPPGQGTGLGLYVIHNIIDHMNGTIDVQSQPGKGTSFKIHLPENRPADHGKAEQGENRNKS